MNENVLHVEKTDFFDEPSHAALAYALSSNSISTRAPVASQPAYIWGNKNGKSYFFTSDRYYQHVDTSYALKGIVYPDSEQMAKDDTDLSKFAYLYFIFQKGNPFLIEVSRVLALKAYENIKGLIDKFFKTLERAGDNIKEYIDNPSKIVSLILGGLAGIASSVVDSSILTAEIMTLIYDFCNWFYIHAEKIDAFYQRSRKTLNELIDLLAYLAESKEDYYLGKMISDIVMIGIGIFGAAVGIATFISGLTGSVASICAAPATGGASVMVLVGSLEVALEGTAVAAASAAIVMCATENLGSDFGKYNDSVNESSGASGNQFKNGELFESSITLKDGTKITSIAETFIDGKTLTLKDMAIYSNVGDIPNAVGLTQFKQWLKVVQQQAKNQGFERLAISAERVANSTSANPGQVINRVFDLTK